MRFDDVIHNNEIQTSRIGGFGGSDAYMFLKVGRDGIGALSSTDRKRIDVAMGKTEPSYFVGNVATESGHRFEEYIYLLLTAPDCDVIREYKLERTLSPYFKTFAHADFYLPNVGRVLECKFVDEVDTRKVAHRYLSQLQWYYLMGAKEVHLVHGHGTHEPYKLSALNTKKSYKDDYVQDLLLRGVKEIEKFIVKKYAIKSTTY